MLMDLALKDEWNWFTEGEWTMEPPTKPGRYYIADRDGNDCGLSFIVVQYEGSPLYVMAGRNSPNASAVWKGFFWSIPVPDMPPIPKELMEAKQS